MHYWTPEGRQVLDAVAGLWCVNAGHGRKEITEAVSRQIAHHGIRAAVPDGTCTRRSSSPTRSRAGCLRASTTCSSRTPGRSRSTRRSRSPSPITACAAKARAPGSSGASAVTTASVSAASPSAAWSTTANFSAPSCRASITCRTRTTSARNAYTRGEPEHGAHLADELERLVALHDASNIAAVIVEPVAGSTGVLIPPKGYLQRLRDICTQARHPADLRRGHHRFRSARRALRAPSTSA